VIKGRKFNLGRALPSKLACQLGGLFYFKGIEPREMGNVPLASLKRYGKKFALCRICSSHPKGVADFVEKLF